MTARALVSLLNLALLAGCSFPMCNAMPCRNSLTIDVRFMSAPQPHAYRVAVTPPGGAAITCDLDTAASARGPCSTSGATIHVTDDSLRIDLPVAPETVHVEVDADTESIVNAEVSPSYVRSDDECDAESCRRGTAAIAASS